MDKIILIGNGGHARACIDVIEMARGYKISGLVAKDKDHNEENMGYPIIGTDDDLPYLRKKYNNAIVTVGQIKSPLIRIKLFQLLNDLNFFLPAIISSRSYVSRHAQIGKGTIVMHGAIVNANARIGNNCIINNRTLIEHDTVIGDHCHIATGTIVNGEVTVGSECFIGSGSITKQCISIGDNCVIGAGVVLKRNIEPNQVINN